MSPDNHLHPQAIDYDIEKEEKYEHTVVESKHLVYELKLGIILIIGGIIIVLCLFYILSQCKRKHMHSPRRQNNDQEKLIGSRDASEHLIHVHSTEKGLPGTVILYHLKGCHGFLRKKQMKTDDIENKAVAMSISQCP